MNKQASTCNSTDDTTNTIHAWLIAITLSVAFSALSFSLASVLTLLAFLTIGSVVWIGIHEIGHVVAALILQTPVTKVKIGTGKNLLSFSYGGVPVSFGINPFGGGYVALGKSPQPPSRKRALIFILGGPIASLLCFIAVTLACFAIGFERSFPHLPPVLLLYGLFAVITGLYLFSSFQPRVTVDGKEMIPDLTQAWMCLSLPDEKWKSYFHPAGILESYLAEGRIGEVLAILDRMPEAPLKNASVLGGLSISADRPAAAAIEMMASELMSNATSDPNELSLLHFTRGSCLAGMKNYDAARRCFTEALETAQTNDQKIVVLENISQLVIEGRRIDLLPEADHYSQMALEMKPAEITLKGTRGSILIEQGKLTEGVTMLQEVLETTQSENDRAICWFYMALTSFKKGETEAVKTMLETMNQHAPPAWLKKRAREIENSTV
ncbi:hypothetical protein DB345_00270 [Spartobacteria bacterium LR76]|nr:hypothetical protein DB345_00270 [Spartobacteria bacterium LR76]